MKSYNAVILGGGGTGKSSLTLRYMKEMFVDSYDPTIEESYRKTVKVDGEMCNLEILDTAGADQFTAMNEYYIKGSAGFILVFSLTQASSMRDVEVLRQQIFRVKGFPTPPAFSLDEFDAAIAESENAPPGQRPRIEFAGGGRRHMPRTKSSKYPLNGTGSDEGSRTSGEDTSPITSAKYQHIPVGRDSSQIPLVIVGTKCDLTGDREVSRDMAIRMATLWGVPYYETSSKANLNVDAVFHDIIRQMRELYPAGSKRLAPAKKKKKKGPCVIQ